MMKMLETSYSETVKDFDPYDRTAPRSIEEAITPQVRIVIDEPPLKLVPPSHQFGLSKWQSVKISDMGGGPRFQTHGFTLTEILITLGIISLILVLCLPFGVHSRENSQRNSCLVNLQRIDAAQNLCGSERHLTAGSPITLDDVRLYINGVNLNQALIPAPLPTCPSGGDYSVTVIGEAPKCSVNGHNL